MPHLWALRLHYFEYFDSVRAELQAGRGEDDAEEALALILRWIAANPVSSGPGWHPYAVAERLIAWVALLRDLQLSPPQKIGYSIAQQLAYLRRTIEWDLGNNHVIVELCGVLAGLSMFGPSARVASIRRSIATSLCRSLDALLTDEGVLCERSSGYHALVLWKLWMTIALDERLPEEFPDVHLALRKMREALPALAGPDGAWLPLHDSIPHWAPPPSAFAALPGVESRHRCETRRGLGIVQMRDRQLEVVMDVGRPAPDWNPAHSHCSIGHVLVWVGAQALITDPGSSTYQGSRRRDERSARLHNAPVVDGLEQSEVWGRFRFGGRARVTDVELGGPRQSVEFVTWDGAARIIREVTLTSGRLTVRDRVLARRGRRVAVLLTFAPRVHVDRSRTLPNQWRLKVAESVLDLSWEAVQGSVDAVPVEVAKSMGVREAALGLRISAPMREEWVHSWTLSCTPE